MRALPTGTVTFLFTDIAGSTRLWEQSPEAMRQALSRHDALIDAIVAAQGGVVVRPRGEGDSRFVVFARATDAVAAAVGIQQALYAEPWPTETALRVRVALHTGEADLRDGDYYGSAVNRCARLRAIAHGGQTLLSQATEALVGAALPHAVTVRSLGQQRLADLQRPEQVNEVLVPGAPADFPPLRSLDTIPNNLPLQLTSFVGREREISEVTRLLRTTRLLTLTGTGGTGKTRLAAHVAADLLTGYPQGVWLVELAPVADPVRVPLAVTTALGLREESGQPVIATLAAALRPRHLLLILDNCEHLLDACAVLLDGLLHACPHVAILATSREALGIAGEVAWRVPSLTLPATDSAASAESVAQYAAIRLFGERAVAVQPGFALTAQNVAAVVQICRRLDGIPLAIELAAARVRGLSLEGVAARLDQRFRLLTGGSRTALPRQQTLQATVDWSYSLLSASEQTLFARLAVFAGGFTVEAAEAVCGGDIIPAEDVLDVLTRLIDKSLVALEEVQGDVVRYRLLETLHHYGRERLVASGEASHLYTLHARYYRALAEDADRDIHSPRQVDWVDRLDAEHDNMLQALAWAKEHGAAQEGLRLAVALGEYWWLGGRHSERWFWVTTLLELPEAAHRTAARAAALSLAAGLRAHSREAMGAQPDRADLALSYRLNEEALAIAEEVGDRRMLALILFRRGALLAQMGDHTGAGESLDRALALFQAVRWPYQVHFTIFLQGHVR